MLILRPMSSQLVQRLEKVREREKDLFADIQHAAAGWLMPIQI